MNREQSDAAIEYYDDTPACWRVESPRLTALVGIVSVDIAEIPLIMMIAGPEPSLVSLELLALVVLGLPLHAILLTFAAGPFLSIDIGARGDTA